MEKRNKRIIILTSEQIQMVIDEWDNKYNINTITKG
jgi:hypothetical protein